jgi:hypothetical protein
VTLSQQLNTFGTVVLDSTGTGQVFLGPQVVREHWEPTNATASTTIQQTGVALNTNTSADTNTNNWSGTNATLVRDAGVFRTAPGSFHITSLAGADPRAENNFVTVIPGVTYNIAGYLFAFGSPGVNCSVQINWYTPLGVYMSIVGNNSALPLGAWTLYTQDVVAPAGSGFGQIRFCQNGTPGAGHDIWGDDLVLSRVTSPPEALCSLYLGVGPTAGQLLGTTRTGATGDTFGFGGLSLLPGQSLLARWTGGDPGATATFGIFGTKGRYGG